MSGIYQQILSFGFIATEDSVASEKVEVNGFPDNELGVRAMRDGMFETMKALVVKKNFESHHRDRASSPG